MCEGVAGLGVADKGIAGPLAVAALRVAVIVLQGGIEVGHRATVVAGLLRKGVAGDVVAET